MNVNQLLADPKVHRGDLVLVRGVRCVDPGPGGFICEITVDGRQLRLDASGLGGETTDATAEKLIGPCNGFEALAKPTYTFDVTFVPTGSGFEDDVTIIDTPEIDMRARSVVEASGCQRRCLGYDRTVIDTGSGERMFCSEDEAKAAGWRAPRG